MTWETTGTCGQAVQRLRASVVHGSVLAAIAGGLAACWITLALLAALLAAPATTMLTMEREGAWGAVAVMRQGSAVIVSSVRPARAEAR